MRILTGDLSCSCREPFALRSKGVRWTLAVGWVGGWVQGGGGRGPGLQGA